MSRPALVPFAYGFRPFFLLAGWYALAAIGLWVWLYPAGGSPLPTLPAQHWHGHEMLFGFVAAAIAGFLLTAVPSWTGARGFSGTPLVGLTLIWLAGRVAFLAAGALPFWLVAVAELLFLPALAATIAPVLLRATNRNTPLLLVLLALWATDDVFLYAVATSDVALASRALAAALNIVLVLITVIGGRIVPVFTANALRASGADVKIRSVRLIERAVLSVMVLAVAVDAIAPHGLISGLVALAAALLHAVRLAGWQGWRSLRQPIVWVLHAAYLWLPLGLLLKALDLLAGLSWASHWLHALGAGAAATMILAVMTRASLGHTGRALRVAPLTTVGYLLLLAAVIVRVLGPAVLPADYLATVRTAGILWIAAFLCYVTVYTPILVRPRADGKIG